jgi:hypothetical protein
MEARENVSLRVIEPIVRTSTALCAFGGCFALISFDHEQAPYVALHKSGAFGEAFREAVGVARACDQKRQPAVLGKRA